MVSASKLEISMRSVKIKHKILGSVEFEKGLTSPGAVIRDNSHCHLEGLRSTDPNVGRGFVFGPLSL